MRKKGIKKERGRKEKEIKKKKKKESNAMVNFSRRLRFLMTGGMEYVERLFLRRSSTVKQDNSAISSGRPVSEPKEQSSF
jgi:hypothetical protein